jgi:PAS domain S-box-containing protein
MNAEGVNDDHLLRESEARYRGIFEYTHSGVVVYRAADDAGDFFIADLNKAAESIESVRRQDILGKSVRTVFPGVVQFGLFEVFQRVWRTGTPEHHPLAFYRDNRITGWRENFVYKLPSGEVVAVYRDETERMLAMESLRRYERIVSASREHMALVGTGYVYEAVNDAYLAAHGKTRADVLGRTVADIHGPHVFAAELKEKYDRCFAGEELHYQAWFEYPERGRRWMDTAYYPYRAEDGSVTGVLVAARDSTALKQLEERLSQAEKMEALGTLASGLAHDFNNLLMGIQGVVSLLLVESDLGPQVTEKLRGIESYILSGSELTRQLLSFTRGRQIETSATDLNELVGRMAAMFERAKKDVRIHIKLGGGLWPAEADQGQIEQVFLNLCVNAWEAMPHGGDLFIETENRVLDAAYVEPYGAKPGTYVRLSVTDTGAGMDEATRQRVFEPFFTTKPLGRGTGLGLTSAYGIVTNHGGIINCYSEKGKGSTFTIYLPASSDVPATDAAPEGPLARGTETVLVVDDDEMVREVTREMLETLGYTVVTARNGEEAVAVFRDRFASIDLVLLDIVMPKLDGNGAWEALKAIKPGVKILLTSGYSVDRHASRLLARGCSGFIQKPCDLRVLSQTVREALDAS